MPAYTKEFLDEIAKAQDVFVWETDAWEAHPRPKKWYGWMALACAALLVFAVATGSYLFAFVVLLAAVVLVLSGNEAPRRTAVQIGHNAVVFDGEIYLFDEVAQFGMLYQPPETKILYIEPKALWRPRVRIELESQDPVAVREHLRQYIKEDLDLRREYLSDIFARLLRI
jgi:FAD/FMN-containing dehydrogenase